MLVGDTTGASDTPGGSDTTGVSHDSSESGAVSGSRDSDETATSLFPRVIETERLRLEPRTREYVEPLRCYEVCSTAVDGIEDVTRWLPWEPHDQPEVSAEFLDRGERYWESGEVAAYAIRPREGEPGAGEIAGFGGLSCDWEHHRGSLGLWLRKPFWGRGYSGERATALVELAFDRLGLETVFVTHEHRNEKSQSAIERYVDRLGGRRDGTLRNELTYADGSVHTEVAYSIHREEWLAATDGGTDVLK